MFFDSSFVFADGEVGKKLFVVIGSQNSISVVVKTTSKQHGRGVDFGCQPKDRLHNFYLPKNSCYLSECTWVCLDEFYEAKANELLQKKFTSEIRHICDLPNEITQQLIECALISDDITANQEAIIRACMHKSSSPT